MKKLLIVLFALLMIGCTPQEVVIDIGEIEYPWTMTPEPTDVPTATPEPTIPMPTPDETMVSIPPLNEMCWTENALLSWFEGDPELNELGVYFNDTDQNLAVVQPEWATREWIATGEDFENQFEIWLRVEDNCITKIQLTTMTNTDTALGDWGMVGLFHGFLSMMADVEYLFFVSEQWDICTELEDNQRHEATAFTFNGFYSARELHCRYIEMEYSKDNPESPNYMVLTNIIWNDTQDWIDANPDATITIGGE